MQTQNYTTAYQDKSDEELRLLSLERDHLMPEARFALEGELARRNLKVETPSSPEIEDRRKTTPQERTESLSRPVGAGQFVAEVMNIYKRHFWFFFKLTLPAVALSWLVGIASDVQVKALMRQVLQGSTDGHYGIYVFESGVVSMTRYFITWMIFSILFAAMCIATRMVYSGAVPSVHDSIDTVRSRLGPLLRVSLLVFGIFVVVACLAGVVEAGVIWAVYRLNLHSPLTRLIVYGIICAASLILSRFGLAIPATMLDDCRPWQSILRSDELTERKWLILAALLAKSVIGGYLAGMAPFWLAGLMNLQLPSRWILPLVSVAAVSAVEPILFIGFTLLYLKTSRSTALGSAEHVLGVQKQHA